MPAVSIIIPVYNSEKYLKRCLDSIFHQNFKDFEVILVDDGSTDHSEEIYRHFEKSDQRLIIIKEENQGAAAARNAGLEKANGKYVMFCDSDDLVSPEWISRLIQYNAEDLNVFPIGAYCYDAEELGKEMNKNIQAGFLFNPDQSVNFFVSNLAGYLCNSMFIRKIITEQNLRFQSRKAETDYNEDLNFVLSYIRYVQKIVYTGFSDYCYLKRNDSLSKTPPRIHVSKYLEKYQVWKRFILSSESSDLEAQLQALSTYVLPSVLSGLQNSVIQTPDKNILGCSREIKEIICSSDLADCIEYADTSTENPKVIRLIMQKAPLRLIGYLKLYKWKQRFVK